MREERALTQAERALVAGMFGHAVDPVPVRIRRWAWFPLQPRGVCMAPMGHIHFRADDPGWRDCFAEGDVRLQAFFLHEITHVWQAQLRGRWWLPFMRHPFCRYDYAYVPGKAFTAYGIEQQAEIVSDIHLMRHGLGLRDKPALPDLEAILPFGPGAARR